MQDITETHKNDSGNSRHSMMKRTVLQKELLTHGIHFRIGSVLLFLIAICCSRPACAWNLQIGVHHLMPKLWTGSQQYRNNSGDTLKFAPDINKTITGQAASVGFFYENILFHFEQGAYRYTTDIPESNRAVSEDTNADVEVMEQRLGVNYHLERELAGLYAGIGITREKEKVRFFSSDWIFEEDVPFFKFGIDMIFGAWRIRVEQIHYSFGAHSAKVSSAGLLLYL